MPDHPNTLQTKSVRKMVRTPCSDKNGLKKGTWTPEEDRKLIAYITRYGHWNWRQLPRFAGLARCGKSCRLRWMNYLRPDIKRGNYTQEEEETIVKLHAKFGNRWSIIASHLPGRSDNDIKNHWNTHLKKRFQQSSVANEKADEVSETKASSPIESMKAKETLEIIDPFHNSSPATPQTQTPDASPMSKQTSLSDFLCTAAEPAPDGNRNLVLDVDDFANFLEANTEPVSAEFWTELYVADISYFPGELLAPFANELECLSPVSDVQLWGLSE